MLKTLNVSTLYLNNNLFNGPYPFPSRIGSQRAIVNCDLSNSGLCFDSVDPDVFLPPACAPLAKCPVESQDSASMSPVIITVIVLGGLVFLVVVGVIYWIVRRSMIVREKAANPTIVQVQPRKPVTGLVLSRYPVSLSRAEKRTTRDSVDSLF